MCKKASFSILIVLMATAAWATPLRVDLSQSGDVEPGFQLTRDKDWLMQNRTMRLVLPRNAYGYGVIELWAGGTGKWRKMGVVPSLGRLVYLSSDGDVISRHVYADASTTQSVLGGSMGRHRGPQLEGRVPLHPRAGQAPRRGSVHPFRR